jgi:hypothetical protein
MPSDLIRGWIPVRVKKTRQNKKAGASVLVQSEPIRLQPLRSAKAVERHGEIGMVCAPNRSGQAKPSANRAALSENAKIGSGSKQQDLHIG